MKEAKGSEKNYLIVMEEMLSEWVVDDMVKATETYKNWQHDKDSFAYGWIMGVKAVQAQLRDRYDIL